MSKYKVGEIVEITGFGKMWNGKRKVTECDNEGISIISSDGLDGYVYFKDVKRIRIENWRQRLR